jgi:hypothetical protein
MSKSNDIEYVEQFERDFNDGYQEFAKAESQEDKDLLNEIHLAMEAYDLARQSHEFAQSTTPLTFDEANRQVPRELSGRKHMDKIQELIVKDREWRSGTNRHVAAFVLKWLLDRARIHSLVRDGEASRRKLKDCTEKSTDLLRQLHDAQQKIARLETMIRLLGHNPDEASSYSGSVETGDPHE